MTRQGLAVLVALLGFAAPAGAADITVSTTADSGAGSLRQALADANAAATPTTIHVPAGTYAVGLSLVATNASQPITIRGAGARATVLDGGDEDRVLAVLAGSTLTVEDVTVTNGAEDASTGGAIASAGTTVLRRVAVLDSYASAPGGGIFTSGTMRLERSTVAGNISTVEGGGIDNRGDLDVVASTIASNRVLGGASGSGGGLYQDTTGSTDLFYATIADNRAGAGTGGNVATEPNRTNGFNAIVANGAPDDCAGAISSPSSGSSTQTTDPDCAGRLVPALALGPLADNGGPTDTMALPAGSPAIDAAAVCELETLGVDQRGLARPGTGCDYGAFEVQPAVIKGPPPPIPTPVPTTGSGTPELRPPSGELPPPLPIRPAVAPLRSMTLSPARLRRARGTTVRIAAATAGRVRFTVERLTPGRRVANRCVRATGTNRARAGCTRRVAVTGSFVRDVRAGVTRFAWKGRLGVRALRPGRYELVAVVVDGTRRSVARRASFTVVPR